MISDIKFNFYKRIDSLCKECDLLIFKGDLGYYNKEQNNRLLMHIATRVFQDALNLAGEDDGIEHSPKYFANRWAGRCHKFQRLFTTLHDLVVKPFIKLNQVNFFIDVLQELDNKIKSLKEKALSQGRLPICSEDFLEDNKQNFEKKLNLRVVSPYSLEGVDQESFHVLASRYPHFDNVKVDSLEGRVFSEALLTTISLVKKTLKTSQRKFALMNALQQALNFAMKMDSIKMKVEGEDSEISFYFEKLSKIEPVLARMEKCKMSRYQGGEIKPELISTSFVTESQEDQLKSFLSIANMRNSPIPTELSLHDIAWDAVQAIEELKNGEFSFIPLGTISHAIIAQVECHIINGETTYTYLLFNTGNGAHHHIRERLSTDLYIRPLKIERIRKEGFSYSFWNEMFSCVLKTNINLLYQLQKKHLIGIGKGRKGNALDEPRYLAQKFGTCTFGASEMAILPHLNQEEKAKLEVVKASYALKKQLKVVKHRKDLLKINQQKQKIPFLLAKLHQSEALLRLSRRYLRESLDEWKNQTLTKAQTFKQRKIKKSY